MPEQDRTRARRDTGRGLGNDPGLGLPEPNERAGWSCVRNADCHAGHVDVIFKVSVGVHARLERQRR